METVAEKPVMFGSQQFIDRLNLLMHREIAQRLAREPERVLSIARSNLARWLKAHERGSSEARCLEEWEQILETRTIAQIIDIITQNTDEGQRLRSSTPFMSVLTLQERREFYRYCEKRAVV